MIATVTVLLVVALLYVFCPFLLWRSYFSVVRAVILSKDLDARGRMSMLVHLGKELLYAPLLTLFWLLDELLWHGYRKAQVQAPVFVMSQPRSGTTFLLRTLACDEESFFVLKHLDWRIPFISFWKLIDAFGWRERLEQIDYWPGTEIGRLASKMHSHNLGSVEGHGVFFEERMYHHYFTFRRFPLPEVLQRVDGVEMLTPGEKKKLVSALRTAVRKAAYYRGKGRFWLTKENENVDIFRLVREAFPDSRFLVIMRPPSAFVSSYIRMSDSCTTPKHGTDPKTIPGWYEANMEFRRGQCDKHMAFCRELEAQDAVTYVTFERFTGDVSSAAADIYKSLGISMSTGFAEHLRHIQQKQNHRDRGYVNPDANDAGFEAYAQFVERVAAHSSSALSA